MASVNKAGILTYQELNQQILIGKGISSRKFLCKTIEQKFFKYEALETILFIGGFIGMLGLPTVFSAALTKTGQLHIFTLIKCAAGFSALIIVFCPALYGANRLKKKKLRETEVPVFEKEEILSKEFSLNSAGIV